VTDPTGTDATDRSESPPVSYYLLPGEGRTWLDARDRYEELTQRDLSARARAVLVARGGYDPARHGTSGPQPLTLTEHLEVLAERAASGPAGGPAGRGGRRRVRSAARA
jgi:hypothetical protein